MRGRSRETAELPCTQCRAVTAAAVTTEATAVAVAEAAAAAVTWAVEGAVELR